LIKLKIIFFFFVTSICIPSCNSVKTSEELGATFYQNKIVLDALVNSLKSNRELDSLFRISPDSGLPYIKNLYKKEYNILKNIGITDASSHPCFKNIRWYNFKTNWKSKYPIYLIYTPCDSLKTFKGFYEKDKYDNEWWGLGDNWYMFRFVKTIDYMKL
jgi:hypothetical protein